MESRNKKYKECENCGLEYRTKRLRQRKGRLICHRCERKELTIVPALNLERSMRTMERDEKLKEKKEKLREIKREKRKIQDNVPKIKGAKKTVNKKSHSYITKDEKRILYKKYIQLGHDDESASEKVNKICNFLSVLVDRLREKKLEEEIINLRFKEEYARLISA